MSMAPPPYPGNEKQQPPPPNPAYPQQQQPGPAPYPAGQYGMQPGAPPPPGYPQPGYQPPPPQQGGYPQGPQQPMGGPQPVQTIVVTQPTMIVQQFRESPVNTRCPHCQADVITGTSYETGTFTWVICALLCIFGCDAGCCLIPFCCDGCKDVVHNCPNCRQVLYRWNRM